MKIVKEGIYKDSNGHYIFNTDKDEITDLISLTDVELHQSNFDDNIYYFGYKFNESASRRDRTDFIAWIKSLKESDLTNQIRSFIVRPLRALPFNVNDLPIIISPRSNRSELVHIIVDCFYNVLQRDTYKKSYEVVKNIPSEVYFDFEGFKNNFKGTDKQFEEVKHSIETELLPKIHDLTYFSLADNVRPKYRKYIQNYLKWHDESCEQAVKAIQTGTVLIIDDINTSGSTLREIIRIIRKINNDCKIYIFTLIGKE